MSIIIAAAQLADIYHKGQIRRNNKRPYKTHCDRVACRVMMLPGMDEHDVAGAFLHDGPEDCAETTEDLMAMHAEIAQRCSGKTLAVVIGMTNMASRLHPNLPRAERKHMDRVRLAAQPVNIKRIKLVDRTENLLETIDDILAGRDKDYKFGRLYADESELLLNESLRGADNILENELAEVIHNLRAVCDHKTTPPVVTEYESTRPDHRTS